MVTASVTVPVEPAAAPGPTATGSLLQTRTGFTATLLGDGKVLIAGGDTAEFTHTSSAELYDPVTMTSTPTGSMTVARSSHAAIRLNDGRVLITGGGGAAFAAEIYDPSTGIFSAAGNLIEPRGGHTMTLLASGKVLILGGGSPYASLGAEIYDPILGTFVATGSMVTGPRDSPQAVRLNDGRVLIVNGTNANFGGEILTAETYNPSTGSFTEVGSLNGGHWHGTATVLADGRVLVAGGFGGGNDPLLPYGGLNPLAEMFDPSTNQFTTVGALALPRTDHNAFLRADGTVQLVYGLHVLLARAPHETDVFHPGTGTFHPGTSTASYQRYGPVLVRLGSGSVLVFGGTDASGAIATQVLRFD